MKKNIFRKIFLIGSIILFLGAIFEPSITGNIGKIKNQLYNKQTFFGSPPEEEWNKTYGGTNTEYGYSVLQTLDGG